MTLRCGKARESPPSCEGGDFICSTAQLDGTYAPTYVTLPAPVCRGAEASRLRVKW
jgi:hypothetical protein